MTLPTVLPTSPFPDNVADEATLIESAYKGQCGKKFCSFLIENLINTGKCEVKSFCLILIL